MLTLLAQFGDSSFNPGTGYGAEVTSNAAAAGSAELIISNVIGAVTVIAGLLLIMYFLWGSVDWIVSGGDSGKVASARNKMVQAVIGMILVVLSYGLIGLIGSVVGIDVLNLSDQLLKISPTSVSTGSGGSGSGTGSGGAPVTCYVYNSVQDDCTFTSGPDCESSSAYSSLSACQAQIVGSGSGSGSGSTTCYIYNTAQNSCEEGDCASADSYSSLSDCENEILPWCMSLSDQHECKNTCQDGQQWKTQGVYVSQVLPAVTQM